jgi:hypothetical protein
MPAGQSRPGMAKAPSIATVNDIQLLTVLSFSCQRVDRARFLQ